MAESLDLGSYLSFETAAQGARLLHAICTKSQDDTIEIDLSAMHHCDSAGLALLLEAKRCAKQYKKRCCLVNISPKLKALCFFYGLEQVLT